MKRTVVQYQAKPGQVAENERLIANVFKELREKAPQDLRYMVLKLADGSFIHFAAAEAGEGGSPLLRHEAFRAFSSTAKERTIEPPVASEAVVVGNYRMLADE
jgi:hypothetical protein